MAIQFNSRKIGKIYHGDRAIKAVYRGMAQVWGSADVFYDDFERSSIGSDWLQPDGGAGIVGTAPNRNVRRTASTTGQSNIWTARKFEYQNTEVEITIPGGHDANQATSIIIGERDVLYYYIEFTNNRYVMGEYDGVRWTNLRNVGSRTFNAGDRVGLKYVNGSLSTWHNNTNFTGNLPSFTLPAANRTVGFTFRSDRVIIVNFFSPGIDEVTIKGYD